MNILLIPDSFKDSISSKAIIEALEIGFNKIDADIKLYSCVASDGGEGFLKAVKHQIEVSTIEHDTLDPIGRPIEAEYLFDRANATAYIEMAQASGFEKLSVVERNPMNTTTVGTGLQIMHAINKGARTLYIGLGGSATNDGGIGMASVLGYSFLDEENDPVLPVGRNLVRITSVKGEFVFPQVKIFAVNDVSNPLIGQNGAAYTYAKQKGASKMEVEQLDEGLRHLSKIVEINLKTNFSEISGSGSAGGSGYGLKSFFNAEFLSGIEFFLELAKIEQLLLTEKIDFIITGEGSIDEQSLKGKLISGIVNLARKHNVKVIAICGKLEIKEEDYKTLGLYYATPITEDHIDPSESMTNAAYYIENIPQKLIQVMR